MLAQNSPYITFLSIFYCFSFCAGLYSACCGKKTVLWDPVTPALLCWEELMEARPGNMRNRGTGRDRRRVYIIVGGMQGELNRSCYTIHLLQF